VLGFQALANLPLVVLWALRLLRAPRPLGMFGLHPARSGLPCCAPHLLYTCRAQYPGGPPSLVDCFHPALRPSPHLGRVGIHVRPFGTCSGFTRVAACVLARPPFKGLLLRGFGSGSRPPSPPDGFRGASTIPRAGLSPAGDSAPFTAHPNLVRQEPIWSRNGSPAPVFRGRRLESGGLLCVEAAGIEPAAGAAHRGRRLLSLPRPLGTMVMVLKKRLCLHLIRSRCWGSVGSR
jgi:hypothetical protein